jgi:hypothetical protein
MRPEKFYVFGLQDSFEALLSGRRSVCEISVPTDGCQNGLARGLCFPKKGLKSKNPLQKRTGFSLWFYIV